VKVHLPSYSQKVHRIEESVGRDELDLDPQIFVSDIHACLQLDRHDPYLDFRIELKTQVHLDCDRCLESYETTLEAGGPMLFVLGESPQDEEIDDTEMAYVPRNTVDLDLSELIRDMLILALPGRRLCSEECRGLCPSCGANLNLHECNCGIGHRGI